jgi:hypothetical protein
VHLQAPGQVCDDIDPHRAASRPPDCGFCRHLGSRRLCRSLTWIS